jgi:PTS system nitrogen regulatory IIA component
MKISQLIDTSAIIPDLKSTDKTGAINELAAAIAAGTNGTASQIADVLMGREQLGSTGIGGGIAIPHGKLNLITDIVIGFGLSRNGVEYDSLDNKPVHIFFVLLTPENSTGSHLKVLAQISKMLKMETFKKGLLVSQSIEDIRKVIEAQDEEF